MNIQCEVLSVKTDQETLTITLQGAPKRYASWRRLGYFKIQVPHTPKNCQTYYLGRIVKLRVTAV